ncbi:MAG: sodium:solute symporter family protein [Bacteroidota bacterium]
MTTLQSVDWIVIGLFFIISLGIGLYAARRAKSSFTDYFLGGRNMPWWLLGVSMVATTFSADTPNLVTDLVRTSGVAGNWAWWAFCLTGMLTVFVYAKLWRRSGIRTDLEFYELRYSGEPARYLRGFRALYLGVFFNVVVMAAVMLAGIKFGQALLGWSPGITMLVVGVITLAYTFIGGLRGVILTDFFQFGLAMVGMIAAAIYLLGLPQVGGLSQLLEAPTVAPKLDLLPSGDWDVLLPVLIIPLAVQWWSVWYPGAEPGGGGYVAQRMLSAKNESHATRATLFFNVAHYAIRPWPWILIALVSLVVFPDLDSLRAAFPTMDESLVKEDLAFPAMLTLLPSGLLGLVAASIIAALMSTISTHLNWGSSYVVNDFYLRFVKKSASETEQVWVGRISTLVMLLLACLLAPLYENAGKAFNLLLQIGAGTGLIFILRWFWWRINAYAEVAAMVISFLVAVVFFQFNDSEAAKIAPEWLTQSHWQLTIGVAITTIGWIIAMYLTRPTDQDKLLSFYQLIKPHAGGWKPVLEKADIEPSATSSFSRELLCMMAGVFLVYGFLFGTGLLLYGRTLPAMVGLGVATISGLVIYRNLPALLHKSV